MFVQEELAYLQSQRLARLATVASDGQPTVDAVGFQFEGGRFIIGGRNLPSTRKYRNVASGNLKVALIIDDLASIDPWTPRGIKVHGVAHVTTRDGLFLPRDHPGDLMELGGRRTGLWRPGAHPTQDRLDGRLNCGSDGSQTVALVLDANLVILSPPVLGVRPPGFCSAAILRSC